jgi:hypothetical protein
MLWLGQSAAGGDRDMSPPRSFTARRAAEAGDQRAWQRKGRGFQPDSIFIGEP